MDEYESQLFTQITALVDRMTGYQAARKDRARESEKPSPKSGIILFPTHPLYKQNIDNLICENNEMPSPQKKEKKDLAVLNIKGVTLTRTPRSDGRYEGKYLDAEGVRRSTYARSYEALEQKIVDILTNKTEKRPKKAVSVVTLGEWLDEWFKLYKAPKNGDRSLESIRKYIETIKKELGKIKLNKLNGMDLQGFVNNYADRPNTQTKISFVLNGSLNKAVVLKKIRENPFNGVEIVEYRKESYRALEFKEQSAIYEAATVEKYRKLFLFCCCTGIRIQRVLELTTDNFDFERMEITVIKKQRKGAKEVYKVPFLPSLIVLPESGRIFPGITYNGARQYFDKLFKKLGIKKANIHSFRHTFISVCAHVGIRDKVIQTWAGHATQQMTTDTYTHLLKSDTGSVILSYILELKNIRF